MIPFFKSKSRHKRNVRDDCEELLEDQYERIIISPARNVEEEIPKPSKKVIPSWGKLVGKKWDKLTKKNVYDLQEHEKKDIACSLDYDEKPGKLRRMFTRRKDVETYKKKETLSHNFPSSSRFEEQQDNVKEPTTHVRDDDQADFMDDAYGSYEYIASFDVRNRSASMENILPCEKPMDPRRPMMPHTSFSLLQLRKNINLSDEAVNLHSSQEKHDALRNLNVASTSRGHHFEITPIKTKRTFCYDDVFTFVNKVEDDPTDFMDGAYGGFENVSTLHGWNKTASVEYIMPYDKTDNDSRKPTMPYKTSDEQKLRDNINLSDEALKLHRSQKKPDVLNNLNVASTSRGHHFEITPIKTKRTFCYDDVFTTVNKVEDDPTEFMDGAYGGNENVSTLDAWNKTASVENIMPCDNKDNDSRKPMMPYKTSDEQKLRDNINLSDEALNLHSSQEKPDPQNNLNVASTSRGHHFEITPIKTKRSFRIDDSFTYVKKVEDDPADLMDDAYSSYENVSTLDVRNKTASVKNITSCDNANNDSRKPVMPYKTSDEQILRDNINLSNEVLKLHSSQEKLDAPRNLNVASTSSGNNFDISPIKKKRSFRIDDAFTSVKKVKDDPAGFMDGAYGGFENVSTLDAWNKTASVINMSYDKTDNDSRKPIMYFKMSDEQMLRDNINLSDEALNLHSSQEKLDALRKLNDASTSKGNHFEITPIKTKRSFCFDNAFTTVNNEEYEYLNNTIFVTTDSLVVYDDETKTYEPLVYHQHKRQRDLNWDKKCFSGRILPSFYNSDIISDKPKTEIDSDTTDTPPGIDDEDDFVVAEHTFLTNDCYLDEENKYIFKMYILTKSNPHEKLGLILTVKICQVFARKEELRYVVMKIEDGVAKRDGRINLGDEVINVNGELLRGNKDLFSVQECLNKWMPAEKGNYASYIVVGRSKLSSLSSGNKMPSGRHSVATSNADDKSDFRMMEGLKYQGPDCTDQDDSDDGEAVLVSDDGTIFLNESYSDNYPFPELDLAESVDEEPDDNNPDEVRLREEIAKFSFRENIEGHKSIPHIETIPESFIERTPPYIANSFYHFKAIFYKRLRSKCLGFSVVGGIDNPTGQAGIYVKKVFRVGQAAQYHLLEEGDQILGVNGVSFAGMSTFDAVRLVRRIRYGRVEIIVARRIKWPVYPVGDTEV